MEGARKSLPKSPESARALEESPPSSRSPIPISVTRQRPAIEPWKVLDLKKAKSDAPASVRAPVRVHVKVTPQTRRAPFVARAVYAALGIGATAAAVWRAHRAGGFGLAPRIHALLGDRPFVAASAAAVAALALSLGLLLMTLYARPRSLGYLLAAVATFIVAMAFTFLALTTGAHDAVGMTAEAVRLIALALPFVPIGVALRVLRNGWDAAREREGLECESLLFAAALATALASVGVELLVGVGLGRI